MYTDEPLKFSTTKVYRKFHHIPVSPFQLTLYSLPRILYSSTIIYIPFMYLLIVIKENEDVVYIHQTPPNLIS